VSINSLQSSVSVYRRASSSNSSRSRSVVDGVRRSSNRRECGSPSAAACRHRRATTTPARIQTLRESSPAKSVNFARASLNQPHHLSLPTWPYFFLCTTTNTNTAVMLYLVGLGLADEKDITVKGLEIVKKASRVYLEAYTAVLLVEKEVLVSCCWQTKQSDVCMCECEYGC
jgi:precorrin-2 methylase